MTPREVTPQTPPNVAPAAPVEPTPAVVAPAAEPAAAAPEAAEFAQPVAYDEAVAQVAPLSDKMSRRLQFQLRERHRARVELAAHQHIVHPDGSSTVFAVHRHDRFEACVGGHADRTAGRAACRASMLDEELGCVPGCHAVHVVRARFAPRRPGQSEEHGGDLSLEAEVAVDGACALDTVRAFELVDLDDDGSRELRVDLVFTTPHRDFISREAYTTRSRHVAIHRRDLSAQLVLAFGEVGHEESTAMHERAGRYSLVDEDGDGRLDLALELVDVEHAGSCTFTDELLPVLDGDCEGEPLRRVFLYDVAGDTWRDAPRSRAELAAVR